MSEDRTRAPYALGFSHSKPIDMPDGTWRLLFGEDDAPGVVGYVEGSTYDECLANAWAYHDRITAPAKAALLRRIAVDMFPPREMVGETDWTKHWREARQELRAKLLLMADDIDANREAHFYKPSPERVATIRAALLRELADECERGDIGFTEEKCGTRCLDVDELRERADKLEKP